MTTDYKQLALDMFENHVKPAAQEALTAYGDGKITDAEAISVAIKLWPGAMEFAKDLPLPNKGEESKRSIVGETVGKVFTDLLAPDNPYVPNFIEKPIDQFIVAGLVVLSDVLYKRGVGRVTGA